MNETEKTFAPLMMADLFGSGAFRVSAEDAGKLNNGHSAAATATFAFSHKTSVEILSMLAKDRSRPVKLTTTLNHYNPGAISERHGKPPEPPVKFRVRELDLCPDILGALLDHRSPYIRAQARLTLEGHKFENRLKEMRHVAIADGDYRLGELLVKSQLVKEKDIDDALEDCNLCKLPLGRALLQSRSASPKALITALKVQTLIRQGSMRAVDAINELVKCRKSDLAAD